MSTKSGECQMIYFDYCRYVTPLEAGYSTEFSEETLADPTGIHVKNEFCGGDGFFGTKKLAENLASKWHKMA